MHEKNKHIHIHVSYYSNTSQAVIYNFIFLKSGYSINNNKKKKKQSSVVFPKISVLDQKNLWLKKFRNHFENGGFDLDLVIIAFFDKLH